MIDPKHREQVPNDVIWGEIAELGQLFDVDVLGYHENHYHVVLKNFPLPVALYEVEKLEPTLQGPQAGCVDLLLRVNERYPHVAPDMFWTWPAIRLPNGSYPGRADNFGDYYGKRWQRFSWHYHNFQWRPMQHTLANTHLPFVHRRLAQGS